MGKKMDNEQVDNTGKYFNVKGVNKTQTAEGIFKINIGDFLQMESNTIYLWHVWCESKDGFTSRQKIEAHDRGAIGT